MENTLDVREQFLADARRHKGNDMTQGLRDALAAVKLATPGPWRACGDQRGGCVCGSIFSVGMECAVADAALRYDDLGGPVEEDPAARKANALAIAVAVNFLRDHGDALLARLTSDGDMVLVPRVPTKAMHAAFYDASSRDQRVFPGPSVVWKAMCDAAAPAQPSEGEPR